MQRLWIPGRLPGLNEIIDGASTARGGYAWKSQKKRHELDIGLLANAQGIKPFGPSYWTYVFVEPNRRRDPSNVVGGGMKIIEDALQKAGLLDNDGWRHVLGFAHFWAANPARPGVSVLVGDRLMRSREEALLESGVDDG